MGTPIIPGYRLLAAVDPAGPYLEEPGAELDLPSRRFTAARPARTRFYRVQGEREVRVTSLYPSNNVVFVHFTTPGYSLQAAETPEGPFAHDPQFEHDAAEGRFTGPSPSSPRFWRVAGEQDTVIRSVRPSGAEVVVEYALVQLRLLEAPRVTGPYQEVTSYRVQPELRTISTPRLDYTRFFRLDGNARARLGLIEVDGNELRLSYAVVP